MGTTNLIYQWFKNGTNVIPGATNLSLTLGNVQAVDAAGYSVLVTNIAGTNFSAQAWLSINLTGGGTTNGWGSGSQPANPPIVSMFSPTNAVWTNAAIFPYGAISIRARASSSYSYVTNVAFYFTGTNYGTNFIFAGNATLGSNSKFALAWTNALPGTNIVKARAWDCNGQSNDSPLAYVIMAVQPALSVESITNLVWTEGAASTNVILYASLANDGQPYSWVTNIQWNVTSGNGQYVNNSAPHSLTPLMTFSTNGNYQLQLSVDNGYATNIQYCTVNIMRRPQIQFNSPTNNSEILLGTPIVLNATATSQGSSIAGVNFYDGTNFTLIGPGVLCTNGAFACAWYNAPEWTNNVYTVATDLNSLASTTSVTVAIAPALAVAILSPINQTFIARTNVIITAYASNSVTYYFANYVQFFANGNSLGYAAPSNNFYQISWYPANAGTDVLTALAVNSNGVSVLSMPVTNLVKDLPNIQFISPANGAIFAGSPTNITFKASVTTNWGTIRGVGFYEGTNVWLPTNTGSPYAFTWTNAPRGIYTMSTHATNSYGKVAISTNIVITIEPTNQPPFVYAGPNQTNYLSATTNWIPLSGFVSDDGLPLNGTLTSWWTNLTGGANVQFTNANLPMASAYYSATGTYVLQLSAKDGQFTNTSNVTITMLPANQLPQVNPGADQVLILPAVNTNTPVPVVQVTQIANTQQVAGGMDYFAPSNCVIIMAYPNNFDLVAGDGTVTPFMDVTNLNVGAESRMVAVRSALGGFTNGEIFCGDGQNGEIMRIEPNGTIIGTNGVNTNAWIVLSNPIDPTDIPGPVVGECVDKTGVWGGKPWIVSAPLNNGKGGLWRIFNAAGQVHVYRKNRLQCHPGHN